MQVQPESGQRSRSGRWKWHQIRGAIAVRIPRLETDLRSRLPVQHHPSVIHQYDRVPYFPPSISATNSSTVLVQRVIIRRCHLISTEMGASIDRHDDSGLAWPWACMRMPCHTATKEKERTTQPDKDTSSTAQLHRSALEQRWPEFGGTVHGHHSWMPGWENQSF